MMGNPMMRDMYGGMGLWMLFNLIFWILLIVGIVLLIVWGVKHLGRYGHDRGGESAIEILKKRYARGEITREEFERMKKDIS